MKKKISFIALSVALLICSLCLVGCGKSYEPYMGKWVTATGEELDLNANESFKSTISGVTVLGTYTVYFNTLILDNETTSTQSYCEWDVIGSNLYLYFSGSTVKFFYQGEPEE